MQAVILAGGKGTRLRPLTDTIPKPLLPIGKKPILEIIIEHLKSANVKEVILTLEYKADLIRSYFGDGRHLGIKIRYFQESKASGTAGPIKLVESMLNDQPFLTMNGDLLTNIDLTDMYQSHLESSAELTMATSDYTISSPYGIVDLTEDGQIRTMREKPDLHYLINAGIYIVSPSVLSLLPEAEYYDMPDLIQTLIEANRKVETYHITGEWHDLGTIDKYRKINQLKSQTQ